jgi:Leucine-rich repeat (LRR) protein
MFEANSLLLTVCPGVFASLVEVDLSSNRLTDISGVADCSQLQRLNVSCNQIARWLAVLRVLTCRLAVLTSLPSQN